MHKQNFEGREITEWKQKKTKMCHNSLYKIHPVFVYILRRSDYREYSD